MTQRATAPARSGNRPVRRPPPRQRRVSTSAKVLVAGGLLAVLAVVIATSLGRGGGSPSGTSPTTRAPSGNASSDAGALAAKLAAIPPSVFHAVGVGSTVVFPLTVNAPPLTRDGKPLILYMGAEYCPFCATERWPLIAALSRFGRFTGLHLTHSASDDAFPDTQTFTFHGSRYESPHLVFEAVELKTNRWVNGSYTNLDTPTPEQRQLMLTYDSPPYVRLSSAGGIPFLDFGGRYLMSGASYNPGLLQGKSAAAIAEDMQHPSTPEAQGAVGTANTLTAAMCNLTGNNPVAVCSDPGIIGITSRFK
jgi:hypothetical protein